MARKINIFDTTLRDGEQAPGIHLSVREKLEIAEQLDKLNVDTIEAGFPISSHSDFNAVIGNLKKIKNKNIAVLARAVPKDIDVAGEALQNAARPVIHTFISSSDIHLKYQFKKNKRGGHRACKRCCKKSQEIYRQG